LGAHNAPEKCKRCKQKKHSKQLDTIYCQKHFEFKDPCEDFELDPIRNSFQKMCSEVMQHRTKNNGWSDWEKEVRLNVLIPLHLKEGRDYKHNFKIQNEEQTGYYELDFFLFRLGGIIEADGAAWHSEMGHGLEKDSRRDSWFMKMKCPTFRVKEKKDFEGARQFIKDLQDASDIGSRRIQQKQQM